MKICIPTQSEAGLNAAVFEHFGSAPYFTIFDTASEEIVVVNNSNQHHAHGMCQPMGVLAGRAVEVVVTGGMGAGAVQKLNAGGIKVLRAVPGTVADVVKAAIKGGLEEITVNNSCMHHDCH